MSKQSHQREVQAEAEVGHTLVHPAVALSLTLFFLLLIIGPLLWDSLHNAHENSTFHPVKEAVQLLPGPAKISQRLGDEGLLRGAARINAQTLRGMESFEDRLQSTSPLRTHLLTPLNRFFSGLLGASNADVYSGRSGWLFYGPALRHVTGPSFLRSLRRGEGGRQVDPVTALLNFQGQLAERGITLVLFPIPGKVSIYPEQLTQAFDGKAAVRNMGIEEFFKQIGEAGVLVFDVAPLLIEDKAQGALYLREDSHWSPWGMGRCAEALAAFIDDHVELPADGKRSYRRGEAQENHYRGDLTAMLYPEGKPGAEAQERVEILPVLERDGSSWMPEEESDVLLLGDSFTTIYSNADLGWGTGAGLAEQLSFYLQRPVARIAQNGNGAFASRQALSEAILRGADPLINTRVLVYEFAARELSWGDWKVGLPMQRGSPPAKSPVLADTISVTGRILQRSLPPTPGSVPYKDCIISLLLEPAEEGNLPQTLLLYTWGMRDHKWTEATGWNVGEHININLRRWSLVNEALGLGSVNRVPLDGEVMNAEPWWLITDPVAAKTPLETSLTTSPEAALSVPADDIGLVELVRQLEVAKQQVLPGKDGWLFFVPELRSLSVGPFWGDAAPQVNRARNRKHADPLPAIRDFHRQLKDAGIELILMPVPPKAGIYANMVGGSKVAAELRASMKPTGAQATFLGQLSGEGITVIDLQTAFDAQTDTDGEPFYCRTDTHWSPRGCAVAAELLSEQIRKAPWYREIPRSTYAIEQMPLTLQGDLAALAGGEVTNETRFFEQTGVMEDGTLTPLPPSRQSPVLLIGDSHNLVFHAGGDMHATGGGLPDLLAQSLGFPVDLVAVRASGATAPRITLARRQDNLTGKKVVVWCFAAREFTESTSGWRLIPVIR